MRRELPNRARAPCASRNQSSVLPVHAYLQVGVGMECPNLKGPLILDHMELFDVVVYTTWAALALGTLLFLATFNLYPTQQQPLQPAQ